MRCSAKVKSALGFTRYSVLLLRCWPPPRTASRLRQLVFELSWWLMFVSALCLLLPLAASVYEHRHNSEIMTKSVCLFCAVSQCSIKSLFCRIRRRKLQNLLEELQDFLENPSDLHKQILEKYVKKCQTLHIGITVFVYMTAVSFIVVPFVIAKPFPTDAVYPFSTANIYVRILVYVHQSLVALQTAAAVLLDCLVAVLLWFLSARFEALALNIDRYSNFEEFKNRVREHQLLIRYTNDVKSTINLFVFSTISTSVGGVLFAAIQLVADQLLAIKAQYAIVAVTASIGLFVCSWAADTLLQVEYLVGIKLFQSNWMMMEKRLRTCVRHVIARSQNPIAIKANQILPTLSLAFFSQFLVTSFKFFASLRIMVG